MNYEVIFKSYQIKKDNLAKFDKDFNVFLMIGCFFDRLLKNSSKNIKGEVNNCIRVSLIATY